MTPKLENAANGVTIEDDRFKGRSRDTAFGLFREGV